MCIRVQFVPRDEIHEVWDRARNVITIPDSLSATTRFTLKAVRAVLEEMGVEQGEFGARCWCGEYMHIPAAIRQQQLNEVIHLGA
ncbi:hypothetical protein [Streptomyces olivaceus]|uniref:hypothetical protein n=1 Tax=Streptomyces olivaceus TaxID=47716 RepID=UPI0022EE7C98|nr:hypothetical protein [Streptomyces olivaceus]GHI91321.1 hypothetical protein TPA0905_07920 [Streptomyces olivaceus]